MSTFGQRLRARRNKLGLTQDQLADRAGVSPSSVTAWERGINIPTASGVTKLADVLAVDVQWLLVGTETDRPPSGSRKRVEFNRDLSRLATRIAEMTDVEYVRTEHALLAVIDAVISNRSGNIEPLGIDELTQQIRAAHSAIGVPVPEVKSGSNRSTEEPNFRAAGKEKSTAQDSSTR